MKNILSLAVALGLLSCNATIADNVSTKQPTMVLAFNNTVANQQWAIPTKSVDTQAISKNIELKLSEKMEKMSRALDKQLEEKLTQEFAYDAQ